MITNNNEYLIIGPANNLIVNSQYQKTGFILGGRDNNMILWGNGVPTGYCIRYNRIICNKNGKATGLTVSGKFPRRIIGDIDILYGNSSYHGKHSGMNIAKSKPKQVDIDG